MSLYSHLQIIHSASTNFYHSYLIIISYNTHAPFSLTTHVYTNLITPLTLIYSPFILSLLSIYSYSYHYYITSLLHHHVQISLFTYSSHKTHLISPLISSYSTPIPYSLEIHMPMLPSLNLIMSYLLITPPPVYSSLMATLIYYIPYSYHHHHLLSQNSSISNHQTHPHPKNPYSTTTTLSQILPPNELPIKNQTPHCRLTHLMIMITPPCHLMMYY